MIIEINPFNRFSDLVIRNWTKEETSALIRIWDEETKDGSDGKIPNIKIAEAMQKENIKRDTQQVRERIRHLKHGYNQVKSNVCTKRMRMKMKPFMDRLSIVFERYNV